ncbi:D-Ala-D-Ala carboxypeptidase family metallohydrolase, partial [Xylanibacter ruminicola]|uniref:D-Ala-D-Ala carboxypeptidase family metallohydrolase n=1 Tax=Xylanibacter ruminicola TaxID=839 RepID=UPI00397C24F4
MGEFTKSNHPEVYNIPSHEAIANLKRVCIWLEELRKRYNEKYGVGEEPIHINSGYRSPQLNKKVGGVAGSNHLTGCAVDIRVLGAEQLIRYANILLDYADESGQDF